MLDNQVIKIFLPIINNGLNAHDITDVQVKQAYQPTQQGVNSDPTVYFFKVSSKRYGYLDRQNKWAVSTGLSHIQKQYIESTWQVSALVTQNPFKTNRRTASDLVTIVSNIMQSSKTIEILNNNGIGILRVDSIRNPYFTDDRGRFEASPSFDFTLVYEDKQTTSIAQVDAITPKIYGV